MELSILRILSDQFAAWHDDATAVSQYSHTKQLHRRSSWQLENAGKNTIAAWLDNK